MVTFASTVTLNGAANIEPINAADVVILNGDLGGSGTLTVNGKGTTVIDGAIAPTVSLDVLYGVVQIGGDLQSQDASTPQVDVSGARSTCSAARRAAAASTLSRAAS